MLRKLSASGSDMVSAGGAAGARKGRKRGWRTSVRLVDAPSLSNGEPHGDFRPRPQLAQGRGPGPAAVGVRMRRGSGAAAPGRGGRVAGGCASGLLLSRALWDFRLAATWKDSAAGQPRKQEEGWRQMSNRGKGIRGRDLCPVCGRRGEGRGLGG